MWHEPSAHSDRKVVPAVPSLVYLLLLNPSWKMPLWPPHCNMDTLRVIEGEGKLLPGQLTIGNLQLPLEFFDFFSLLANSLPKSCNHSILRHGGCLFGFRDLDWCFGYLVRA